MIRFRRPQDCDLSRRLLDQSGASLTYPDEGATKGKMPAGFEHDELTVVLGKGRQLFEACSEHLDQWGLQRSMGFIPFPDDSQATEQTTILLSLPMFRVTFVASCRVVYTVHEQTRHGFAYGTLPMHPECGEEYFGIRINESDVVHFDIRAFSKPRATLARLGRPITRRIQLKAMHRYGAEMQVFANSFEPES